MPYGFLDIASTPGVRAAQEANGSGEFWANFDGDRLSDRFTQAEAAFIADARQPLYGDRLGERLALRAAPRRPARLHPRSR